MEVPGDSNSGVIHWAQGAHKKEGRMITKQERELAKHEIADISYDLSVRDGILGLDQVKAVLRKSKPSHHSNHTTQGGIC